MAKKVDSKKKAKPPLSKTHPELAKQAFEWDPSIILAKSNKNLKWICAKNHIWSTKVSHRTSGSNCPYCYGRLATPGINDLLNRSEIRLSLLCKSKNISWF